MNKRVSRIKKGLVLLVTLVLVLSMGMVTSADYYLTNELLGAQPISKTFTVTKTVAEIAGLEGEMKNPADLFIDQNDWVYVVDTDNHRIVVLDNEYKLVRVIGEVRETVINEEGKETVNVIQTLYGPNQLPMNKPQGIYVDEIGDMYIADTASATVSPNKTAAQAVSKFIASIRFIIKKIRPILTACSIMPAVAGAVAFLKAIKYPLKQEETVWNM